MRFSLRVKVVAAVLLMALRAALMMLLSLGALPGLPVLLLCTALSALLLPGRFLLVLCQHRLHEICLLHSRGSLDASGFCQLAKHADR